MAITSSISILSSAAELPEGYTPAALTPISGETAEFVRDVAVTEAHASVPATGLTAVLAAVKTYFDGTYAAGTLKLDTDLTITANLLVTKIERVNTAESIFLTGTEVFRCTVKVRYN